RLARQLRQRGRRANPQGLRRTAARRTNGGRAAMKILAIRLKNLASLAGPFEIDFTAEPLASAGLFAITGPTGAGKSTLLDALCLALFGAVARLNNTGRAA